ncbi:MAG: class I SAM-dependent methyltransferase [Actinomycetota bacterium]|jgi:MMP 1-O-methyltransferase|nr:class I SAM-dependent methyltransferase [Actinomycetota bacterium]
MRDGRQQLAQSIKGFMPHDEGLGLYRAALETVGGLIVEVGSYCGKSTVYIGTAAEEVGSTVFTIDHHRGSEEMQSGWDHHDSSLIDPGSGRLDSLPVLRRTLEDAELEATVVAIVGDAGTVARHWTTPVAMVFIDGGHGPIPAHADFDGWAHHVVPGGLLAIHDVFPDPADGGRPPYEIFRRALDGGDFEEHDEVGSLRVLRRV